MKPAPLAADQIRGGHLQVVDEEHVGIDRRAPELVQLAHFDRRRIEVGEEQAHAVGFLFHIFKGRGAREDEHLLGFARLGGENLAPIDDVIVALAPRRGLDMRDVVAGIRLGHREGGVILAAHDRRQEALFLFLGAVKDDRADAEDREMDRARGRHRTAGARDFLHHEGRLGDAESAAAVGFRDRDAEISGLGDRGIEVV